MKIIKVRCKDGEIERNKIVEQLSKLSILGQRPQIKRYSDLNQVLEWRFFAGKWELFFNIEVQGYTRDEAVVWISYFDKKSDQFKEDFGRFEGNDFNINSIKRFIEKYLVKFKDGLTELQKQEKNKKGKIDIKARKQEFKKFASLKLAGNLPYKKTNTEMAWEIEHDNAMDENISVSLNDDGTIDIDDNGGTTHCEADESVNSIMKYMRKEYK